MRTLLIVSGVLLVADTAFACGSGEVQVEVLNYSSVPVDELLVSDASGSWSSNLLAATLLPGGSTSICVEPGDHDLFASDTDTGDTLEFFAVTFAEAIPVALADVE